MAPVSLEDDLKLLYSIIKLSETKAKFADVANFMGLKENATRARFQALMKRLEKDHGVIDEDGAAASTQSSPAAIKTPKRKRATNNEARMSAKKTKVQKEVAGNGDVENGQAKEANLEDGGSKTEQT